MQTDDVKSLKDDLLMELQRPDKIIVAMSALSGGTPKPLSYEDIVVKAFQMFPQDFALRGYPQYPDSSDIHKPLYGPLKRAGYVLTGNKQFRLTPKGLERAQKLSTSAREIASGSGLRLTRVRDAELQRIYQTEAFRLFVEGNEARILDTDFYAYLGVTVRTERNEFLGRLNTVQEAVDSAAKIVGDAAAKKASSLHQYLSNRFSDIIQKMRAGR